MEAVTMKRITLITVALVMYSCAAFADSSWGGGAGTLQQVTDKGATSTAEISVGGLRMGLDDYIRFGASGTVFLLVDSSSGATSTLRTNSGFQVADGRVDGNHALTISKGGNGRGIYVNQTSGAGQGVYAEMAVGTTGQAFYCQGSGNNTCFYGTTGATDKPVLGLNAYVAGFTNYVTDQQIRDVTSTGHHALYKTSKYMTDSYSNVAILSRHGSLALGYDVAVGDLGSSLVSTNQNVLVASGSVGIKGNLNATGTAYFGGLVTATSGINFGASGGGSDLNYYYEGTWTPAYDGVTTGDCATGTAATGTYTVIGNVVTAQINIAVSACAVAPTGATYVSLPIVPKSTNVGACSIGYIDNYTLTANNIMTATIFTTAAMRLWQTPVGGGAASVAPTDTAWTGYFSCTYQID
jgi:hypothetical protein